MELNEEPEEDVPCRLKVVEPDRLWEGLLVIALSESEEDSDLGGDGSLFRLETRSYGLRVRRIGLLGASNFDFRVSSPFSVFGGKVSAQFSHGIARFLSFSS